MDRSEERSMTFLTGDSNTTGLEYTGKVILLSNSPVNLEGVGDGFQGYFDEMFVLLLHIITVAVQFSLYAAPSTGSWRHTIGCNLRRNRRWHS